MKKVFIVFLAFLVLIGSSVSLIPKKANALGVDTAIKIVAGTGAKQVVRGLGEKIGMKLAPKQLDNAVAYINNQAAKGNTRAVNFVQGVKGVSPTASTKSGFRKWVIDPAMWLSGADLLWDFYEAVKGSMDNGTNLELMCNIDFKLKEGYDYENYLGVDAYQDNVIVQTNVFRYKTSEVLDYNFKLTKIEYTGIGTNYRFHYDYYNQSTGAKLSYTGQQTGALNSNVYNALNNGICVKVATAEDVPDISNVNNTIINNFDNDTYNTETNYKIEIETPVDGEDDGDDNRTWNDIDITIINEIQPPAPPPDDDKDGIPNDEEPDSDGDGVDDDTDSTPDKPTDPDSDGGLFENLIPVVLLIGLFDLLSSVLMYLVRMFTFILTIPVIPAKPIDNVAFIWFREAKIIGVHIYTVVSSLGTVGLSFAVYKAVRRLLV